MRSFQSIIVALFALLVCAFAQQSEVYDATVYITSTVYRVNTVTASGSPSAYAANVTSSTISASHATYPAISSVKVNGTSILRPSGTAASPTPSQFTGAAAALNVNAYVAMLAAGVGYLVL